MKHTGKSKPRPKPSSAATGPVPDLEQKLRQRAYELYESRGREEGHELDDWLTAEVELKGQKARAAVK